MNIVIRATAVAATILLTACAGSRDTPAPQRYDLGVEAAVGQPAPGTQPVLLAFDAGPTVSDGGMLWRVGDSASPNAYANSRWVAPPVLLVSQRITERVGARRPVADAAVLASAPQARIVLTQFEQVFSDDGASSEGRLAMQVMLVRDRQAVGATQIVARVPAPTQDAAGGVQALRQAATEAGDKLASWLDGYLK